MSERLDVFGGGGDAEHDEAGSHPLDDFGAPNFRCLGLDGGSYFFLPNRVPQIIELTTSALRGPALMRLADQQWWQMQFPGKSKEGGVDWNSAVNAIIRACEHRGVFDPSVGHGRGAAYVGGRFVFNTGEGLIVDGRATRTMALPGASAFFAPGAPLRLKETRALDGESLVDALATFAWRDEFAPKLVAGWLAIAPIGGALERRPHLWIEGDRGSGKTTLLKFLADLLGPCGVLCEGGTTEAGVRQRLRHDALPVLLDESEGRDERSEERVAGLIELARSAYSSSGVVLKGTAGQRGTQFAIRSCFAFASIANAITSPADRTRIVVLPLRRPSDAKALLRSREFCDGLVDEEFGLSLAKQSISRFDAIRLSARTLAAAIVEAGCEPRVGDTIGMLLSGWWSLRSAKAITTEEARRVLSGPIRKALRVTAAPTDGEMALQHMLSSRIPLTSSSEITLAAFAEDVRSMISPAASVERALAMRGFRFVRDEGRLDLYVATTGPNVDRHFERTPWAKTWRNVLRQHPSARVLESRPLFLGHRSAALAIDYQTACPDSDDRSMSG